MWRRRTTAEGYSFPGNKILCTRRYICNDKCIVLTIAGQKGKSLRNQHLLLVLGRWSVHAWGCEGLWQQRLIVRITVVVGEDIRFEVIVVKCDEIVGRNWIRLRIIHWNENVEFETIIKRKNCIYENLLAEFLSSLNHWSWQDHRLQ